MFSQFLKVSACLFLFIFPSTLISQKIFINEIVADNGSTISDLEGEAPDWIEIYNQEDTSVNLKNYALSE